MYYMSTGNCKKLINSTVAFFPAFKNELVLKPTCEVFFSLACTSVSLTSEIDHLWCYLTQVSSFFVLLVLEASKLEKQARLKLNCCVKTVHLSLTPRKPAESAAHIAHHVSQPQGQVRYFRHNNQI